MTFLKTLARNGFDAVLGACLSATARGMNRELERRSAERGQNGFHWLTREEAVTAEALAKIIVPSDEESPGIEDVCVLGPDALVSLDKLIVAHAGRQSAYSRGLWSFDRWAMRSHGCNFATMSSNDQADLFRRAQELHEAWSAGSSLIGKLGRKLRAAACAGNGAFFAAKLCPIIRDDCLRIFYTSRVSWAWLEYDGPPMDEGYPGLARRRETANRVTQAMEGGQ